MNEDKAILSIDPGSKGFLCLRNKGDFRFYSIADNDLYQLSKIMAEIHSECQNIICSMELIHAVWGSSAKATFSFGEINGMLKGLLVANKIPFVLVQPKEWQKEIWINTDMVYKYSKNDDGQSRKSVDTKQTSYNAARRLFPDIDLRKSTRAKKFDDNKVDALLIGEYARRKNL